MSFLRRGGAILAFLVALATLFPLTAAQANHCAPKKYDLPGLENVEDRQWCHTPAPQPTATPKPSTTPGAPTTAPTTRPQAPAGPVRTTAPQPSQTPFDIELDENALETPDIIIDPLPSGIITDDTNDTAGGGASNFILGLLVGFLIGALVGRASGGFSRKRRQQIFG